MKNISSWMSWEGGVDLVGFSMDGLPMPNIIVHVARMVHTPVGSAPSGVILLPDDEGAPRVMGFVSSDAAVGAYFGPNIFAGTPFEAAPILTGSIKVDTSSSDVVSADVTVEGYSINLELSGLGGLALVERQSPDLPFRDDSIEAAASHVKLIVNGVEMKVMVPPVGMSGGPAAVYSAAGLYSR